jgi:RHS repeat-associated protein
MPRWRQRRIRIPPGSERSPTTCGSRASTTRQGLSQNYFRDFDPAVGGYAESDPIGLKAGVNTYVYVLDRPVIICRPDGPDGPPLRWNDPMRWAGSLRSGKSEYSMRSAIHSGARGVSHCDWQARYGVDSCRNKTKGSLPVGGPDYALFKKQSECKAYKNWIKTKIQSAFAARQGASASLPS